jgi:hypothetical protein
MAEPGEHGHSPSAEVELAVEPGDRGEQHGRRDDRAEHGQRDQEAGQGEYRLGDGDPAAEDLPGRGTACLLRGVQPVVEAGVFQLAQARLPVNRGEEAGDGSSLARPAGLSGQVLRHARQHGLPAAGHAEQDHGSQ